MTPVGTRAKQLNERIVELLTEFIIAHTQSGHVDRLMVLLDGVAISETLRMRYRVIPFAPAIVHRIRTTRKFIGMVY